MTTLLKLLALAALVPQDLPPRPRGDAKPVWEAQGTELRFPEFPWRALTLPGARKANFWMTRDGALLRYTVYVDRAAIPSWVHQAADAKLGAGEDLNYEIERYPDGAEVYEIYRKIDGRERQFSVKSDRSFYYLGEEVDLENPPAALISALDGLRGAKARRAILKEGPTVAEYHVSGEVDGLPCRIRISKDGRLIAVQRRLPAEIEIPLDR